MAEAVIQNLKDAEKLTCITCHAFNADRSKIAFCPNNHEVHIYKKQGTDWVKEALLVEHDQTVTGIDWGHKENRIVTCSQDRNSYVWIQDATGTWKPTLVLLRITRAATHVKWSPDEQKFAVATGAKCVSVCYFESVSDWWVSKHIKNHKSTVLSVAWHPNSLFLATGASDFKVRIFSAFIKGVDKRPTSTPFGDKLPLGEMLAEYPVGGWVHNVAWSPSGDWLGFASHDSTVGFVNITAGKEAVPQRLALSNLPFRVLGFLSENEVVAAGYDCNPALFKNNGGQWEFARWVDEASVGKDAGSQTAMNMWQKKADLGTTVNETQLGTKHQNAISCLTVLGAKQFSTTAVDGKLILWTLRP